MESGERGFYWVPWTVKKLWIELRVGKTDVLNKVENSWGVNYGRGGRDLVTGSMK